MTELIEKTCKTCGQTKPIGKFRPVRTAASPWRRNICTACRMKPFNVKTLARLAAQRATEPKKQIDRAALTAQLEGHFNEPTLREPVRAYIRQLDSSFTLRDIYPALGLQRMNVNREINRMLSEGLLDRTQIVEPYPNRWGTGMHTRAVYLYSLVEPE